MMNEENQKLTLFRPVTYQIKVPGALDQNWSNWVEGMTIVVDYDLSGAPVTTLTGEFDQAALIGLLRRLYSNGLPLVSIIWVNYMEEK